MSAPVTEAHKQLVATIVEQAFRFAEGNHKITPLSQLIADSEAKAVAELRAEVERWELAFQEQYFRAELTAIGVLPKQRKGGAK